MFKPKAHTFKLDARAKIETALALKSKFLLEIMVINLHITRGFFCKQIDSCTMTSSLDTVSTLILNTDRVRGSDIDRNLKFPENFTEKKKKRKKMASKKKRVEDVAKDDEMSDHSDAEDMEEDTEMEIKEV